MMEEYQDNGKRSGDKESKFFVDRAFDRNKLLLVGVILLMLSLTFMVFRPELTGMFTFDESIIDNTVIINKTYYSNAGPDTGLDIGLNTTETIFVEGIVRGVYVTGRYSGDFKIWIDIEGRKLLVAEGHKSSPSSNMITGMDILDTDTSVPEIPKDASIDPAIKSSAEVPIEVSIDTPIESESSISEQETTSGTVTSEQDAVSDVIPVLIASVADNTTEAYSDNVTDVIPDIPDNDTEITEVIVDNVTTEKYDDIDDDITDMTVFENLTEDITEIITDVENISEDMAANITTNIIENITPNIMSNVSENMTEEVSMIYTDVYADFFKECVDTCNIKANLTNISLTIELSENSTLVIDSVTSVLEAPIDDVNMTVETIQYPARAGEPVKWMKKVSRATEGEIIIDIPASAYAISTYEKKVRRNTLERDVIASEVSERSEKRLVKPEVPEGSEEARDARSLKITEPSKEVEIEYYTPAPVSSEIVLNATSKKVFLSSDMHYSNVTVDSALPFEVKDAGSIVLRWLVTNDSGLSPSYLSEEQLSLLRKNGVVEITLPFTAIDSDGNSLYDSIEWIAPHLSNQTFEIILITKASHLDENKALLNEVYAEVSAIDDIFASIPDGHYLRVTFEKNLSSSNDITIYARANASSSVEVYEKDGTDLIAAFEDVLAYGRYRIILEGLSGMQDTFDLRVIGDVDFDYVVDPSVTTCNNSINTPGVYTLQNNVTSTGTCFTITAANVTLDCNGFTITYSTEGAGSTRGIYVDSQSNITIRNCRIMDGNRTSSNTERIGIYLNSNYNSTLLNNYVNTSNGAAIRLDSSDHNYLTNNTGISNSSQGIRLLTSSSNMLINNTGVNLNANEGTGITHGSLNNVLIDHTSSGLYRGVMIWTSHNNTFINSDIFGNEAFGFYYGSYNNTIIDCVSVEGATYDVGSDSGTSSRNNTLINCSYDTEYLPNVTSELIRKWYFDVNVTNSTGSPLNGSNVAIFNYNGSSAYSVLTNIQGDIARVELIEYIDTGGTKNYITPHTVNVTKTGYITNTSTYNLTMLNNTFATLVLTSSGNHVPSITFEPPTPNDGSTVDSSTQTITANITDPQGLNTSSWIDFDRSLLGYWAMDYYNNSGIYDNSTWSSFVVFNGGQNTSHLMTGIRGQALEFDGTDYVLTRPTYALGSSATFEAWGYSHDFNNNMLWNHPTPDYTNYFDLYFTPYDTVCMNTGDSQDNPFRYPNGTEVSVSSLGLNVWHHYVVVADAVSNQALLYLDGINIGNASYRDPSNTNERTFSIGGAVDYRWDGLIDEFRIYNRSLSAEEVAASYNSQVNRFNATFTGLSDGRHNYTVYAMDASGNFSTSGQRSFIVDVSAPSITFEPPTPSNGFTVSSDNATIIANITDFGEGNTSSWIDFDRSLIGYWSMDYYNSTGIYDNSTWSHFGAFQGGLNLSNITSGSRGSGLEFDGVDDYVSFSNYSSLNVTGGFTVSLWARFRSAPAFMGIISKADTGSWSDNQYFLGTSYNGDMLRFGVNSWDNEADLLGTTNITDHLGQWMHIVAVFNNDSQNMNIYINGVAEGDPLSTGESTINNTDAPFEIGREFGGYYFNGSMDEIMLFNRYLSPQEILALYDSKANKFNATFTGLPDASYAYTVYAVDESGKINNSGTRTFSTCTSSPYCANMIDLSYGLVGHWGLEEGNGSVSASIHDSSSNTNDGTITESSMNVIPGIVDRYAFNGTEATGYVTVPYDPSMNASSITASVWLKNVDPYDSTYAYFRKAGEWHMYKTGGYWGIAAEGTMNPSVTSPYYFMNNQNEWHLHTMVIDADALVVKFYVDGVQVGPDGNLTSYAVPTTGELRLGRYSSGYRWRGGIDDYRLYNYSMTDDNISDMYWMYTHHRPNSTGFNGQTTDFTQVSNYTIRNMSGVVLENTSYGSIRWNGFVNATTADFSNNVRIGYRYIYVNSSGLDTSFNSSANITFYNTFLNEANIYRDGVLCGDCSLISNIGGNLTYSVTGFSNYTVEGDDAPFMLYARFNPAYPDNGDNLIGYCNGTDPNGYNLTYYYAWYVNGLLNSSGRTTGNYTHGIEVNVNNVSNTSTVPGDSWIFSCMAGNGLYNGSWTNSSAKIIDGILNMSYGLVGHWGLEEDNGSTTAVIHDNSLNTNDGTITEANMTVIPGIIDRYAFYGHNESGYITVPYDYSMYTDNITASAWLYNNDSTSTSYAYFRKVNEWHMLKNGYNWGIVAEGTMSPSPTSSYSFADNQNKWHLHTMVIDAGEKVVRFYVDGVQVGSNYSLTSAAVPTTGELRLGRFSANYRWRGGMDDFRLYNYSMSSQDVRNLYRMYVTYRPSYTSFNGQTTDFTQVSNYAINDMSGLILENTTTGKIVWNGYVNTTSANFDSHVRISNRSIYVNSSALHSSLNSSANVTFYNTGLDYVAIYRDGSICTDCSLLSVSGSNYTFTVPGFSNYTLEENVSYCMDLDVANSLYTLVANVTSTGTCFNITAENVTLDCNGNWINYTGVGGTNATGVYSDQLMANVRNCNIGNFTTGIRYDYVDNGTIVNNTIDVYINMTYTTDDYDDYTLGLVSPAIFLYESDGNLLKGNDVYSEIGRAIYLMHSSYNTIDGCNGTSIYNTGIHIYGYNVYNTIMNSYGESVNGNGMWLGYYGDYNSVINSTGVSVYAEGLHSDYADGTRFINSTGFSNYSRGLSFLEVNYGEILGSNGSSIDGYGLSLDYGSHSVNVTDCITSSLTGVATLVYGSDGHTYSVHDSVLRNISSIGILGTDLGGYNNSMYDSYSYSSGYLSIRITGDNNTIINTTSISGTWRGMSVENTQNITLKGNNVSGGTYAYYLGGVNHTSIYDCVDTSGGDADVYVYSDAVSVGNTVTNCSYDLEYNDGAGNDLTRRWYFDANVTNGTGSALNGVNVTIYNSSFVAVDSQLTDSGGDVDRVVLTEYVSLGGSLTHSTPHYVNVSKIGYITNSTTYNLTSLSNTFATIVLNVGPYGLTQCGNLNVANSVYVLQNNVSYSGTCVNITANNVSFDCNRFALTGGNVANRYGIFVNASNVNVKNCLLYNWSIDMNVKGAENISVTNITGGSDYGLIINGTSNSNFDNLLFTNISTRGILITGDWDVGYSYNNSLINVSVNTTGTADGIVVDGGENNYIDCAGGLIYGANSSNTVGFSSDQFNTTVKNCNIRNFDVGIWYYDASNGTIQNNTVYITSNNVVDPSYSAGILLHYYSSNNLLIDNNAYSAYGPGIFLYNYANHNQIIRSIGNSTGNNGIGLYESHFNYLSGCNAISYDAAMMFTGSENNTVHNSSAETFGTNAGNYGLYLYYSSKNNISSSSIRAVVDSAVRISGSDYDSISDSNIASEYGESIWMTDSGYNNITRTNLSSNNYMSLVLEGQYCMYNTFSDDIIRGNESTYGALVFINDASNNTVRNSIINGLRSTYAIVFTSGTTGNNDYNSIINNTILNATNLVYLSSGSNNNLFYWNNFTNASGYYVQDLAGSNKFNTTITSQAEGNIWYNVINGSVNITGEDLSGYGGGFYIGDAGSKYPYNGTNSNSKVTSNVYDYAPLIRTETPYLNCSTLGTANTVYALTKDVTSTGTCFNITAENVTLDCDGHWINYSTGGVNYTYGVYTDMFNTTVKNCNIVDGNSSYPSNNKHAIYVYGGDNCTIINNYINITNSHAIDVREWAYYTNIINNTVISRTGPAIYIYSNAISSALKDNIVFSNTTGIYTYNGAHNTTMINNTVDGIDGTYGTRGIYVVGSHDNYLDNNTVIGAFTYGVLIYGSNYADIYNVNISGPAVAIGVWRANNTLVKDSIYLNASDNIVYVLNEVSMNTTLLNCSYSLIDESVTGENNTLFRKWYFDANVTNSSGSVLGGANLTVYNYAGSSIYSELTDVNGDVARVELIEYVNTGGTRTYSTPHELNVSLDGYTTNTTKYNLTVLNNTFATIVLSASPNLECGMLDSANTVYNLSSNVTSSGTCFNITAENITLDCNGYWINYSTSGWNNTYGIVVARYNTTIKNCNVLDSNWSVSDGGRYGIYLVGADHSVIYNNFVNTSDSVAIRLTNSIYASLINNTAIGNDGYGIYIYSSDYCNLTSNLGRSSTDRGFASYNSNGLILINNTGISASNYAMMHSYLSNSTLIDNIGIGNTGRGLFVWYCDDNIFINTSGITYGSGYGVFVLVSYNNTFINSSGVSNTGRGIYIRESKDISLINYNAMTTGASGIAVSINASNNTLLRECINITGGTNDLYIEDAVSSINNTFINCSYNTSKEIVTGASNEIIRKWYFDANVTNSTGQALNTASVDVFNNTFGNVYSTSTDVNGDIVKTELTEYVNTGGTRTYSTPHELNVSKNGYYTNTTTYNLTAVNNTFATIMLYRNTSMLLDCGSLSIANAYYTLATNVSSLDTCFWINNDNITLDCNGHWITFSIAGATYAVGVVSDRFNTTIKNCNILDGNWTSTQNRYAIQVTGNVSLVQNIFANVSNGQGFSCYNGNNNIIYDSEFFSVNGTAIRLWNCSNSFFFNTGGTSITAQGIFIESRDSSNDVFSNCTGNSGGHNGIDFNGPTNITILNSKGISSSIGGYRSGISVNGINNTVSGSNGTSDVGSGIAMTGTTSSGNIVYSSTGYSKSGPGIHISYSANNTVSNSTGLSNSSYGFYLEAGSTSDIYNSRFTSNYTYAIYSYSSTSNELFNNTLISGNGTATLMRLQSATGNNTFYWNNFTNTSGLYIQDLNGTNKYNTTIDDVAEGNIYYNIINGSVNITGSVLSGYGDGLYSGDAGSKYPYNGTNSNSKVTSNVYDYAPLTLTETPYLNCSTLSAANTVYTMTRNVASTGTCFTISADNVTLDCNGYRINYSTSGTAGTSGVDVSGINVTIKKCNIIDSNWTASSNTRYGIHSHSDRTNISDNYVSTNNSPAIYLHSYNNLVYNNLLLSNSSAGLYAFYSNNNMIINNTAVSNSSDALSLLISHNNTLRDNLAVSTWFGAYIESSDNTALYNNNFTCTGTASGLYLYASSGNIVVNNTGRTVSGSGFTITACTDTLVINNTGIGDSYRATTVSGSTNITFIGHTSYTTGGSGTRSAIQFFNTNNTIFRDCGNISGGTYDILYNSGTSIFNITFLNCSYDIGKESCGGENNTLSRKWYFDANVTNSTGSALSGANLTVYNYTDSGVYSELTNSSGDITRIELTEYVNTGGTRTYSTPHVVNVTKKDYATNSTTYNITSLNNVFAAIVLEWSPYTPPNITNIVPIGSIDPIESSQRIIYFNFTVDDAQGNDTINVSSALVRVNNSGIIRQSSGCSGMVIKSTAQNISCNVSMQYYDPAGIWNINISIEDTMGNYTQNTSNTFTYNMLYAVSLNTNTLDFGPLSSGDVNKTSNVLTLNNTGNFNYTLIQIKAYNLVNGTYFINASNFRINITNVSTGAYLSNDTFINISGAMLPRSTDASIGNQSMYIYVDIPLGTAGRKYSSPMEWVLSAG